MATVLTPDEQSSLQFAEIIKSEGVVAIPTETVYGLAANAYSEKAALGIFAAKERPLFDPLIVHIPAAWKNLQVLDQQGVINLAAMREGELELYQALADKFWPGPLTLVMPRGSRIPDLITSGLPTVAVRMPAHPVTQQLLGTCQLPLAAPSANRFGRISPTNATDVVKELGDKIPLIIDGGECSFGVESTIVQLQHGESSSGLQGTKLVVLRPGAVGLEAIKAVVPELSVTMADASQVQIGVSPGILADHYAPRVPLILFPEAWTSLSSQTLRPLLQQYQINPGQQYGILSISPPTQEAKAKLGQELRGIIHWRSLLPPAESSSLSTEEPSHVSVPEDQLAARRLFKTLRELDESGADVIICEFVKKRNGLWHAIADRLKRASHNKIM